MGNIRCKFRVVGIKKTLEAQSEIVSLSAVGGGTPENESFSKWTPQGDLSITVNNPNVVGTITLGAYYYLDLTLCEAE